MTADTLSGWTAAAKYAGIAPKSFPTRKAWYQKNPSCGGAYYDQVFKVLLT
jgi:hypothetical protein